MASPKIIIVDDNDLIRTLLRGILRAEDWDIIGEARNGTAAAERDGSSVVAG